MPAAAQPPPHAKAHGWRKKNDPAHSGYVGHSWPHDYGVASGRCNTAAVLGVVGAAAGTALGSRGGNPPIGVIVGTAIGAVIGTTIGREIDRTDQACIGHALELAPPGQVVTWSNDTTRVSYTLTPVRDVDRHCRQFRLVGRRGGQDEVTTQVACSTGDGRWRLR